ncbi:MAG: hypothetical protein WCJ84_00915 [Candidatus Peregrinibacteria bacterium]
MEFLILLSVVKVKYRFLCFLSPKASNDLIMNFVELGILEEMTGYKRNRIFAFREYLNILQR